LKKKLQKKKKYCLLVKGIRPIEVPHKGKKAMSNVSLTSKIKNNFNSITDLDPPPYIGKEDRLTLTFEKKNI
jgi:hypothetical protein